LQQGATLFWRGKDEHASEQRELVAKAEMALQNLRAEAQERLLQQELQLQRCAQQMSEQHAADILAEKQSARIAAERDERQRRSMRDAADRDAQRRTAHLASQVAAAEQVKKDHLEAKRRELLEREDLRHRQREQELERKIYDMQKNQGEREELVREHCQGQMDQQKRKFLGERATREQEFNEKALEFERQVRSGGATASRPPILHKLTPSATEAEPAFHPATPPKRGRERREFLSPQDSWSECQSEPKVAQAAWTTTKTKVKTTTRASRRHENGPGSDPEESEPSRPSRKPPSSQGGLGF
jgi:dTMP kinase